MWKQLTGEPYALIAPVRFGGRGGESQSYPYDDRLSEHNADIGIMNKVPGAIEC